MYLVLLGCKVFRSVVIPEVFAIVRVSLWVHLCIFWVRFLGLWVFCLREVLLSVLVIMVGFHSCGGAMMVDSIRVYEPGGVVII